MNTLWNMGTDKLTSHLGQMSRYPPHDRLGKLGLWEESCSCIRLRIPPCSTTSPREALAINKERRKEKRIDSVRASVTFLLLLINLEKLQAPETFLWGHYHHACSLEISL
ncbi:hypothetical protein R1sor_014217 [Riccia sorocarpa]|uniref:Uncharacterized protein n=1 Tax=Riccia sorocarpa TaxID=122646 RepID=A0ABD3H9B7_9MARC